MHITVVMNRVSVDIELRGVTQDIYDTATRILDQELGSGSKNRDAIAAAFVHMLRCCPDANASDLWHHAVYRQYLTILPKYRPQDPGQSWKRASGDALEVAIQQWYTSVFSPHDISLEGLFEAARRRAALAEIGISADVGSNKLDMAIYAKVGKRGRVIIGGVHVKASLAERVSDDIPASRAIMAKGLWSPLWTLDVKSFPPPQGDLVNHGELGSPDRPSEKRKYIEQHGEFSNCYSANSRTFPSDPSVPFGHRVYAITMSRQPDQFATDVIAWADHLRGQP